MGDVTDLMLEGVLCITCGGLANREATGYPVECGDCKREKKQKKRKDK